MTTYLIDGDLHMHVRHSRLKMLRPLLAAALLVLVVPLTIIGPAHATTAHDAISGTGSSWSANAINQWVADVQSAGLRVVYTAPGSAQGRKDFANYNNDFGVSDIGYQGVDSKDNSGDSSTRPYAYLPVVAGGTAFPYNLKLAGKQITNLRLSGQTLAKIFTNQITTWNDAAIEADNNQMPLPPTPIVPVTHSEGAGSTAQFTRYLATEYPSLWTPFNDNKPGMTEYFPTKQPQIAQSGSDGVMNYITSASGNGTIGYDEYSYALGANFPVAKIENTAGYYTLPTQYNDAVALTQAQINTDPTSPDYLLQNLDNVYTYNDPRTYPLSSYSYGIIPTAGADQRMTTAKRQTLADFLFYSVCNGQAEMGKIGYSPLPLNLVQASFAQVGKLHTADPAVDVTSQKPANCSNPTFDKAHPNKNLLAEIAPAPLACDKNGQGPCGNGVVVTAPTAGAIIAHPLASANSNPSSKSTSPAVSRSTAANGAVITLSGGVTRPTPGTSTAKTVTRINPDTGQVETVNANGANTDTGQATNLAADPTTLQKYQQTSSSTTPAILAVVLLLLVLIIPPLLSRRLASRKTAK